MNGHIWKFFLVVLLGLVGYRAQAGTVTYIYTDIQGTPVMEADAQGNITARFDYTPYGAPVQGLSGSPNGPGYTGHVNDPDTGFVYMQTRYYDPQIGRFLSVDPINVKAGFYDTLNRYSYVGNRPTIMIDPDGRENVCIYAGTCMQQSRDAATTHPFSIDGEISATGTAAWGGGVVVSKGLTKNTSDSIGLVLVGQGLEASIDGSVKVFSLDLPKGSEKVPVNFQASGSLHILLGGRAVVTLNEDGHLTIRLERGFGLGESFTYLTANKPINTDAGERNPERSNSSSDEQEQQVRKEHEQRMQERYLEWTAGRCQKCS